MTMGFISHLLLVIAILGVRNAKFQPFLPILNTRIGDVA